MLTKKDVQSVVKDFNGRVVKIDSKGLVLEIPDERYEELKSRLQDVTKLVLDIKSVKSAKGKNIVEFSIAAKSPSEEILDVFSKYYEGTRPTEGYED
ncbi:MAG: hypothetical protein HYT72_01360 [Candidatus Aenigmarchaeota archaeon]|nr:hypothetical protein [Candidatus Aenigmarchaeota archaeon]